MIQKIVLYGSGKRCRILCKILLQSNIEIVRIVDTDSSKWGDKIEGFEVENPDIIERLLSENLCITVADVDAIKQIRDKIQSKYKYDLNKEIHYHQLILEAYKHCLALKKHIMGRAINTGRKQSILFDCYNGLILGGVEAWTMELCKELINDGRKHIYIISDEGNYHVPLILGNHIVYADINHEEQFSIKSISFDFKSSEWLNDHPEEIPVATACQRVEAEASSGMTRSAPSITVEGTSTSIP